MVGPSGDFDVLLDICRDAHRRIVLAVLANENRAVSVNDLATAILTHNHHAQVADVSEETMRRVRVSLVHVHLPKLAACDVVDYDAERRRVEPAAAFDRLQPTLSTVLGADPDGPPVEP